MEIGQHYTTLGVTQLEAPRRGGHDPAPRTAAAGEAGSGGGQGVVNHIGGGTFRSALLNAAGPLATDPASLEREIARESGELSRRLGELLEENGIDAEHPYQLRGTREGGVEVLGGHPDNGRIEGLINADPKLSARFNEIGARSSLSRAMGQASEFQGAYRNDPRAATARYANLFLGESPRFNLAINGESSRGYFTPG